jgi:hypothetical protein
MIAVTLVILCGTFGAPEETAEPHAGDIGVEGFRCVVGDNEKWENEHGAGYNGVFLMETPGMAATPFVPAYAGLNLEHYFDLGSPSGEDKIIFEPRRNPMVFSLPEAHSAELYQPPTPHYGVESWTRFEVKSPGRLDMRFRCVPHKPGLEGGVLGVFWASYINAPMDKSIYFLAAGSSLDKPVWEQYATQKHNRDSTVLGESDTRDLTFRAEKGTLYNNLSALRYSVPSFYGKHGDQVLIYIFEPAALIRFSHSPSGGGPNPAKDGFNPAWDFQYLIPGYETGKEYGFRMRLVCKPWKDRADILAEVRACLREMENGDR